MRNFASWLLLGGLTVGCTVNNVERDGTGGVTGSGGSSSATGGSSSAAKAGSSSLGGAPLGTGGTRASAGTGGVGGASAGASATVTGGTAGSGGSAISSSGGTAAGGASSGTLTTIKLDASRGECDIAAPTAWTKAVYDLSGCGIAVSVGDVLTIEAGAILKFPDTGGLYVLSGGSVRALGTASLPIVFTSMKDDAHGGDTNGGGTSVAAKGDWGSSGAGFGDVDVSGDGSSEFNQVQFLYGSQGLRVNDGSAKISSGVFAHNANTGLVLAGSKPTSTALTGNAFFDNGGFPLSLDYFVSLDSSNIFHDPANAATKNGKQCVALVTTADGPILDSAINLGVTELAFYGSFEIASTLTLSTNNVCFKCSLGDSIALDATGTIVNWQNTVFTSANDDSIGGDCLGDGASTPAAADWDGIWVNTGSVVDWAAPTNNIRYTDETNAGTLPLH